MHKAASILRFFSRVTEDGDRSIPAEADKSVEMAPFRESVSASYSEGDSSTSCLGDTTLQLTPKQRNAHNKFAKEIKGATGLDLLPAPFNNGRMASQCSTCLTANKDTFIRNVTEKWVKHAKVCPGLLLLQKKSLLAPAQLSAEAQAFVMHLTSGGERHRQNTCDAYVLTYWLYKYKLPFTAGDKLKEVCITHNPNRNPNPNNNLTSTFIVCIALAGTQLRAN